MLQIIKAKDRNFRDIGWLQTYWLFSFSDYYDPANLNHGRLRVFNDDIVQPRSGISIHPHEEMEIVSVVLDGEMVHKDTMGNENIIRKNDVQRMTAGTGLQHSEMNHRDEPVAFFQIWILPDKRGLEPSYDQKTFAPEQWRNRLLPIASDRTKDKAVSLNSEASIYRSRLDAGLEVSLSPALHRCQFLYLIEGNLAVNNQLAAKRDQLRIHDEKQIVMKAQNDCDFILIDVPWQ